MNGVGQEILGPEINTSSLNRAERAGLQMKEKCPAQTAKRVQIM
jgi:hypothetical protein